MSETMKIKKEGKCPKFLIHLWDRKLYEEAGLTPEHIRRMFSGQITFVQSGEKIFFKTVAEMLSFMERNR